MKENIQYASLRERFFFAMQLLLPMKYAMIWQVNYQHDWLVSESYNWYICSVTFYRVVTLANRSDEGLTLETSAFLPFICSFLLFLHRQTKQILCFFFFFFFSEKWGITSWPCCWMKNTRIMSKHHHLRLNWLPCKIIESFSCHCTSL